jgi:hypothetical protein
MIMNDNGKPQKKSFVVDVWREKAYIPSLARFNYGMVDIDPVYIVPLKKAEMITAILKVIDSKEQQLPDQKNPDELLKRKSPILLATGARSWKELAKTGYSYSIDWPEQHVRIDMSRLDKHGRWEFDPNKTRVLPPDTALEDIVDIILNDVELRRA